MFYHIKNRNSTIMIYITILLISIIIVFGLLKHRLHISGDLKLTVSKCYGTYYINSGVSVHTYTLYIVVFTLL